MLRLPVRTSISVAAARRSFSASAAASSSKPPLLISPEEYKKLPSPKVPLDVSWHMPNSPRSALAEYLSGPRIPAARRFDLDEVAELDIAKNPLSLTHMLPSFERFKQECEQLGITKDTHVVVYDSLGVFSAPRGAFTFRAHGHEKVSILEGGLPRWIAEGYETESGQPPEHETAQYDGESAANKDTAPVRSYEEVVQNSEKPAEDGDVVLDMRALPRYTGEAPEPRAGLSSGHIPNSRPLPFQSYLSQASDAQPYTAFKPASELQDVLVDAVGGEKKWSELEQGDKALVFSCGSGMTAAIGWAANEILKEKGQGSAAKTAIYDESWTGYASRKESKIVKGEK